VAARLADYMVDYRFQRICWMFRISNARRLPNLPITHKNYFVWEFFVVSEQPGAKPFLDSHLDRPSGTFPGQCGISVGRTGFALRRRVTIRGHRFFQENSP
jgi:hypothetical protein